MHVATGSYSAPLGDVDWTAILNQAIITAGQIARPGSASPIPTYTPTPYRSPTQSLALAGVAALGLFWLIRQQPGSKRR